MPDYKFKMSCSLLMAEDLTNSLERGWFVHIFLIGNKATDGQDLFSLHLSACILEANERGHNWKAERT